MKVISLILNLPWTLIGLIVALISIPEGIKFTSNPGAIVITIKSFWWYVWLQKGIRAMAIGNVVLLGPHILDKDLEHELIHVEQFEREPFIHPFLYQYQNMRYGYRNNKYERRPMIDRGVFM